MLITLKPEQFSIEKLNYETMPNSLVDGYYNKLEYCDDICTMRGVFIEFELEIQDNKPYITTKTYQSLCSIEQSICEFYISKYEQTTINNNVSEKISELLQRNYGIKNAINASGSRVLEIKCIWETKAGRMGLGFCVF
jgi:hypothetical protein